MKQPAASKTVRAIGTPAIPEIVISPLGLLLTLSVVLLTSALTSLGVYGHGVSDYKVKAAGLYNFARFIEWPDEVFPDDSTSVVIGILGDNPFKGHLKESIEGKTVRGRTLVVRDVKREDCSECHILFISPSEEPRLEAILADLKALPVLTVGDSQGFASSGGMIGFVVADNRIRCEINLDAADRAGLRVSPKLLKLSKIVKEISK